jgi:Cytochrome C oxidase subunit II, periplasmic domain
LRAGHASKALTASRKSTPTIKRRGICGTKYAKRYLRGSGIITGVTGITNHRQTPDGHDFPHKAHGPLRGLSKQRFQRAFMPQCGRLRSISVCGLEPTDPPPQKIKEEMKGAPYRPRPEGRYLRLARSGRATHRNLRHELTAAKLWASGGTNDGIDAVPGRMIETWFKAEREGIYYGKCSRLCGTDHSNMPIAFLGVSVESYAA